VQLHDNVVTTPSSRFDPGRKPGILRVMLRR